MSTNIDNSEQQHGGASVGSLIPHDAELAGHERRAVLKARFEAGCEAVAHLIGPPDSLSWLPKYFEYWANPLGSEWSIALLQPTRANLKGQLTSIAEAANVLDEALSDVVTTAFLERQHGFAFEKKFADLHDALRSLGNDAYRSAMMPIGRQCLRPSPIRRARPKADAGRPQCRGPTIQRSSAR